MSTDDTRQEAERSYLSVEWERIAKSEASARKNAEAECDRLRLERDAEYTQGRLHYDRAEALEVEVERLTALQRDTAEREVQP